MKIEKEITNSLTKSLTATTEILSFLNENPDIGDVANLDFIKTLIEAYRQTSEINIQILGKYQKISELELIFESYRHMGQSEPASKHLLDASLEDAIASYTTTPNPDPDVARVHLEYASGFMNTISNMLLFKLIQELGAFDGNILEFYKYSKGYRGNLMEDMIAERQKLVKNGQLSPEDADPNSILSKGILYKAVLHSNIMKSAEYFGHSFFPLALGVHVIEGARGISTEDAIIIAQRYLLGRPQSDIAESQGTPYSTINSKINRNVPTQLFNVLYPLTKEWDEQEMFQQWDVYFQERMTKNRKMRKLSTLTDEEYRFGDIWIKSKKSEVEFSLRLRDCPWNYPEYSKNAFVSINTGEDIANFVLPDCPVGEMTSAANRAKAAAIPWELTRFASKKVDPYKYPELRQDILDTGDIPDNQFISPRCLQVVRWASGELTVHPVLVIKKSAGETTFSCFQQGFTNPATLSQIAKNGIPESWKKAIDEAITMKNKEEL